MAMNYVYANTTGLYESFIAAYDFESNLLNDCADMQYPPKSSFNNFGKCMSTWADLCVTDYIVDSMYMNELMTLGLSNLNNN